MGSTMGWQTPGMKNRLQAPEKLVQHRLFCQEAPALQVSSGALCVFLWQIVTYSKTPWKIQIKKK